MPIDVIIPAYNEEQSVGFVVKDICHPLVRHVIVVNNNSGDNTRKIAQESGAVVLDEPRQGYGYACLKGMEWANSLESPAEVIVFMDADRSDYAEEMDLLVQPILTNQADMVIGSRAAGIRERGSMTIPQVFGNWLATLIIRILFGHRFTDLGPFRAIRLTSLNELGMSDKTYGWTVEMQIRALRNKLRCTEVPVSYRRRIGVSKVSGTVRGTIMAGYKIITLILRYALIR
jgi:glycosyltransferase involved in cell wall biosynthesis